MISKDNVTTLMGWATALAESNDDLSRLSLSPNGDPILPGTPERNSPISKGLLSTNAKLSEAKLRLNLRGISNDGELTQAEFGKIAQVLREEYANELSSAHSDTQKAKIQQQQDRVLAKLNEIAGIAGKRA